MFDQESNNRSELYRLQAGWRAMASRVDWNLALDVHFPKLHFREVTTQRQLLYQKPLSNVLNKFDRLLMGASAVRSREARVPRFVVFECNETVGLHVHMLLYIHQDFGVQNGAREFERLWLQHWKKETWKGFEDRAVYSSNNTSCRILYNTKSVGTPRGEVVIGLSHFAKPPLASRARNEGSL